LLPIQASKGNKIFCRFVFASKSFQQKKGNFLIPSDMASYLKNVLLLLYHQPMNHFLMATDSFEKDRLEFITVAAEFCIFIEHAVSSDKQTFIEHAVKYLPTLYLKTVLLPHIQTSPDDESERMVTEAEYENIRNTLEELLGIDDRYLTAFHPEMNYSETPIAASISEDLTDVFQELKDFLFNCQLGDEALLENALINCLFGFHHHWGRKLLNALTALHQLICSELVDQEDEEVHAFDKRNQQKDSFLQHQLREESEDF
jgi:hypothetical protein